MNKSKFLLTLGLATVLLSCSNQERHDGTAYLETPVPYEVQKHFDQEIKWDKWRQEAWLRGDLRVDSNEVGQKWLFIEHNRTDQTIPSNAVEVSVK